MRKRKKDKEEIELKCPNCKSRLESKTKGVFEYEDTVCRVCGEQLIKHICYCPECSKPHTILGESGYCLDCGAKIIKETGM